MSGEPSPPLAARLQVQQNVREQFVAIEEIKLLRQAVNECYYKEGVNHLENCKEEVAAYLARTRNGYPTWGALKESSNTEG